MEKEKAEYGLMNIGGRLFLAQIPGAKHKKFKVRRRP